MKKLRPLIFLIFLAILILLVDSLFLHFVFPLKKQKMITALNEQVQQSLEKKPPSDSLQPIQLFDSQHDFITVSKNCLESDWKNFSTFPMEYSQKYKIRSRLTEIENFHIKTSSGDLFRIHVIQDSRLKNPDVQLFRLDSKGLPTPVALTLEQRQLTSDVLIQKLKENGTVYLHETKERWQLENGQVLVVTFSDKQIQDFQLFTDSKTFSCEKDQCYCF